MVYNYCDKENKQYNFEKSCYIHEIKQMGRFPFAPILRKIYFMNMETEQKLEKLLKAYECYFDISKEVKAGDIDFPARAEFHSRSEKYILVKSATIWALEMNEYVYFNVAETLDEAAIDHLMQAAISDGLTRIHPHKEHMYSYVTLVLLCEGPVDADVMKSVKRKHFYKSFWLSLHGWMEFRIAVMDLSNDSITTNRAGKDVRVTLEQNLSANSKKERGEIS